LLIVFHTLLYCREGLTYFDGRLFESIGLNGQSELRELDPETGAVINAFPMDKKYFGEGLTHYNGTLIQLTWQSQTGFLYDVNNLDAPPKTFHFTTTKNEGWGLTYDPDRHELIESDGSANLHIWHPDTLEQLRVVPVTRLSGNAATNMNELEYWRGRILANIWYQDSLIVIDHVTGKVEKEYGKFSVVFCRRD
jgi:glutaminyl-peptide cyclotransferase